MANPYGIELDDNALRWAAAEAVSEAVVAAVHLLPERSVDEIVAKLTARELRQLIKLVGLCPSAYPPHKAKLVVAKLDRLSRNTRFLLTLIESGVDIYFSQVRRKRPRT